MGMRTPKHSRFPGPAAESPGHGQVGLSVDIPRAGNNHHEIRSVLLELKVNIRPETPSDIEVISQVTKAAFEDHPISRHTEQHIVQALRNANALTLSLVAEVDGQVVGHIAFSPVTISDSTPNWYGIGPVSVLPQFQRRGIGKSLIQEGLSMIKRAGGAGCVLVGDPIYYGRFGFRNIAALIHEGVPQEVFLGLPFDERIPRGSVVFHEGFRATE